MDKKEPAGLIDMVCNNDWCTALEIFWNETLFDEESRLRLIIERLRLAVVPIAILPFDEKYLYAKYIGLPSTSNELQNDRYKLLVKKERPDDTGDKKYTDIPLAPGIFDSICIDNPYIWNKYLPLREDAENVEKIDKETQEYEKNLFLSIVDDKEDEKENKAHEGQFIIPLFFGKIPVYCLMIVSNTITPKVFNARYLRETFDMIARIGESILAEEFISPLWENFCEKYKEEYGPDSKERRQLFDTLEIRILGKHIDNIRFSSWIHSLPGHTVDDNDSLNKTTEDFKNKNKKIKVRLLKGDDWYIDQLKCLLDNNEICQLFTDVHDIKHLADYKNTEEAKQIVEKFKGHLYLFNDAKKIIWFKEILNEFEKNVDYTDNTNFIKLREAFYKLKTVLNKTDYKTDKSKRRCKQISAGFIHLWPTINKIDEYIGCDNLVFQGKDDNINNKYNYAYMLDREEDNEFDIFEFTKTFYRFVIAFNKDDPKTSNPCKIKQIEITVDGDAIDGQSMIINCVLSQEGFSIKETFKDTDGNTSKIYNKLATILKGKGITTNIFK